MIVVRHIRSLASRMLRDPGVRRPLRRRVRANLRARATRWHARAWCSAARWSATPWWPTTSSAASPKGCTWARRSSGRPAGRWCRRPRCACASNTIALLPPIDQKAAPARRVRRQRRARARRRQLRSSRARRRADRHRDPRVVRPSGAGAAATHVGGQRPDRHRCRVRAGRVRPRPVGGRSTTSPTALCVVVGTPIP